MIDSLTTARNFRNGSPLLIVAKAAAVAVASPYKHDIGQDTRQKDFAGLLDRPMLAVIKADSNQRARSAGGLNDLI